jgi:hypothetical protein
MSYIICFRWKLCNPLGSLLAGDIPVPMSHGSVPQCTWGQGLQYCTEQGQTAGGLRVFLRSSVEQAFHSMSSTCPRGVLLSTPVTWPMAQHHRTAKGRHLRGPTGDLSAASALAKSQAAAVGHVWKHLFISSKQSWGFIFNFCRGCVQN